jgi:hypothetical protein
MWFQLILIAGLIEAAFPAYWVVMLCLLLPVIFMFREPGSKRPRSQAPDNDSPPSAVSDSEERSKADELLSVIFGVATAGMFPFSLGLGAWEALIWLAARLSHGSVVGFRPDTISSFTVGGVAVIISLVAWASWAVWTGHSRKSPPQIQS